MYTIGIDIGGTNLKAGIVDDRGSLLDTMSVPLRFTEPAAFGDTLVGLAIDIAERNRVGRDRIRSVGMGFPGSVDDSAGVVIRTTNIPIRNWKVAEVFQSKWNIPVHLGNDADCAAWGEYRCFERDADSLILVTLGTGVGTGVIWNGRLLTGANGCACEGGHMVIVENGRPCPCGRRGCWEQYASATALIRDTREAMESHANSYLWKCAGGSLEAVDGRTAFAAMHMGDDTAKLVVDRYIRHLAAGITNFINIFQPDVVCLGGGVSHAEEKDLLLPLRHIIRQDRFDHNEIEPHTRIVTARLGNDAGIIGAALLGSEGANR